MGAASPIPAGQPDGYPPPRVSRLLYVLAHSTDDPDRAASALHAAARAADAGHEVALWLHSEGVRLGVRGVAETLREPGPGTPWEHLDRIAERGGGIYCAGRCLDQRGFDKGALRAGARREDPEVLGRLVSEGWTPVPT